MHPSIQALHPATTGPPAQEDFGYDNVGNREDITNPALYARDTNNRITTSPNRSYSFDATATNSHAAMARPSPTPRQPLGTGRL